MSERNGQCVCGASIPQVERSPGIWRPLLCRACLLDEVTRLGRVVTLDVGPWRIFRPGQIVTCPGVRRQQRTIEVPCPAILGEVGPGTIVRVRPLINLTDQPEPPCLLPKCRTCSTQLVLQTLEQPRRVA